jgi:hypothetical protein
VLDAFSSDSLLFPEDFKVLIDMKVSSITFVCYQCPSSFRKKLEMEIERKVMEIKL